MSNLKEVEIMLRAYPFSIEISCRPIPKGGKPVESEFFLTITAADRFYCSILLTDEQRKSLLLELHRAPKNTPVMLFADHDM
jgi:hypothetical protein